ncbi:NAD(P)H-dependent glycerol-3-phosphate dehydrogenase [Sandaracinomonas limnophila]|uniref:Glycerol-3-phosphate dehydrogenase n=1 Tax=Sandaracinomonas limnophila TaxID=1862386 RepID=A0A437PTV8_9BACT|nr:NAD(P)H-dependent glycerol-3-phosphate dehydrogenase [Sandaracinomonas limnophila]RVU25678.1 NAD(P)H-dependent glycerol-3-phosphate dehydrogenase [Sandaracinomonas limnophila]
MVKFEELKKKIPTQITVLGGGSWATALVKILCENNVKIKWWIRRKSDVDFIRKYNHNPSYLTDVVINPRKVKTYHKMSDALNGTEYIILAIPAAFIPSTLKDLHAKHFEGKKIVSAIKGMIPDENILVTDWMEKAFNLPLGNSCVIAGPCHAEEIALEKQSYLTIASPKVETAQSFANLLNSRFLQAHAIGDLYGVEYCAVIKNIIAIACGITRGLGFGDNFQAVLVSNAMQEIKVFLDKVYPATERDLNSSGYLGDLLVTAYSQFSRNRTFGNMLGKGYSVKSAQMEMNMIAEGYYAVKSIYLISKSHDLNLPIIDAVYNIVYGKANPKEEMGRLKGHLK